MGEREMRGPAFAPSLPCAIQLFAVPDSLSGSEVEGKLTRPRTPVCTDVLKPAKARPRIRADVHSLLPQHVGHVALQSKRV